MANLGRRKPRGPGIAYGERAPTVAAAVELGTDWGCDCDVLRKNLAENAGASEA